MESRYDGIIESCVGLIKYIDKTENYKKNCLEELSKCDKKLSDLDHLLELEKLDGIKMTKVVSLRKKILQERRSLKKDIAFTEMLIRKIPNIQSVCSCLKETKSSVLEFELKYSEKQYTPNILFELFPHSDSAEEKLKSQTKQLRNVDKSGIIKKSSQDVIHMERLLSAVK